MLLASCNGDYDDWADPLGNGEETAITIPGFTASSVDTINLNSVGLDTAQMSVFSLSTATLPEGYDLSQARVEFLPLELNGGDAVTPYSLTTDVTGLASASDLQSMVAGWYGKRPVARKLTGVVYVWAMKDGAAVKINAGTVTDLIVPQAPEIDTKYYITGNINNWENANTDFEVVNGGGDPYDDPVFSILIPYEKLEPVFAAGNNLEFKLTPASMIGTGDWTKCVTAAVDGAEGKLADKNAGGNIVATKLDGNFKFYKFTFNLLDQTWSYEGVSFSQYIYEIGDNTGWSTVVPLASPKFDGVYLGFAYLNGEYKFRPNESDWDGDWGQQDGGALGNLVQEGEVNCGPAKAGYYAMKVDLTKMQYEVTPISSISIIGTVNGNWDTDTELTYNAADGCWETTAVLNAGKMKFRANHDWVYNWGGSPDNLVQGGSDMTLAQAGTYLVKLYALCDGKAYFTMTKK